MERMRVSFIVSYHCQRYALFRTSPRLQIGSRKTPIVIPRVQACRTREVRNNTFLGRLKHLWNSGGKRGIYGRLQTTATARQNVFCRERNGAVCLPKGLASRRGWVCVLVTSGCVSVDIFLVQGLCGYYVYPECRAVLEGSFVCCLLAVGRLIPEWLILRLASLTFAKLLEPCTEERREFLNDDYTGLKCPFGVTVESRKGHEEVSVCITAGLMGLQEI